MDSTPLNNGKMDMFNLSNNILCVKYHIIMLNVKQKQRFENMILTRVNFDIFVVFDVVASLLLALL